ncbi:MAG TPA: hypothetical protein VJL80_05670 [Aeromicrobium sp.]|nr:hypothetical protein [Aeromicrobium sp.]
MANPLDRNRGLTTAPDPVSSDADSAAQLQRLIDEGYELLLEAIVSEPFLTLKLFHAAGIESDESTAQSTRQ